MWHIFSKRWVVRWCNYGSHACNLHCTGSHKKSELSLFSRMCWFGVSWVWNLLWFFKICLFSLQLRVENRDMVPVDVTSTEIATSVLQWSRKRGICSYSQFQELAQFQLRFPEWTKKFSGIGSRSSVTAIFFWKDICLIFKIQ